MPEQKSIDYFIDRIGLGKFQVIVYLIIGIYYVCDGAEVIALSFLNVILKNEWGISDDQVSMIGSYLFVGFFLGSLISGIVSDYFGRKYIFMASVFLTAVLGNVSAMASTYKMFLISRSLYGFFVGIMAPLTAVMLAEITPTNQRGKMMVLISSAFTIGELVGWFVAYLTLSSFTSGNWRIMLMWITIPAMLGFLASLCFLKESPRYELLNNFDEGVKILNHMNTMNNGNANQFTAQDIDELRVGVLSMKQAKEFESNNIAGLFVGKYTRITLLFWVIWYVLSFVYYGIIYIYPTILQALNAQNGDASDSDFFPILVSILGEIPSYIFVYTIIEIPYFGRKNSLVWCFFFGGIVLMFSFITENILLSVLIFAAKFFANCTFSFVYPYTTEMYHTKNRATGLGFASAVSRIGGIMMPWISMTAFSISPLLPFFFYGLTSLVASFATMLLPNDTTGKELDKVDSPGYNDTIDIEETEKLNTTVN